MGCLAWLTHVVRFQWMHQSFDSASFHKRDSIGWVHHGSIANCLDGMARGRMERLNDADQVSDVGWINDDMSSDLANGKNFPNDTMGTILMSLFYRIYTDLNLLKIKDLTRQQEIYEWGNSFWIPGKHWIGGVIPTQDQMRSQNSLTRRGEDDHVWHPLHSSNLRLVGNLYQLRIDLSVSLKSEIWERECESGYGVLMIVFLVETRLHNLILLPRSSESLQLGLCVWMLFYEQMLESTSPLISLFERSHYIQQRIADSHFP